jgi:dihydroorotase
MPLIDPLLIRNGRLLDPAAGIDAEMDLLLDGGRVADVAAPGKIPARSFKSFDARGLVISPGLIDMHVHLRQPGQEHKETIASGTAAAAVGGFTSVCCMPNTTPVNDTPDTTRWIQAAEREAVVNVFPIAAATVGSLGAKLTDYGALKRAGAVAVSDDGKPILHDEVMERALRAATAATIPVIQHAEDTRLTAGCSMNLGPTSIRLGLRGMPVEAEAGIVERDLRLARKTGAQVHIAHISTKKALDAVRRAKKEGLRVTCEVTPHHFTLLDEHAARYDSNFKMNPPLRSAADRDAMVEGLLDGSIDAIATDHAPHAPHEKLQEFDRAPFGIIGLETALAIVLQVLHHHRGLPLARIIELMSVNPARILGLRDRGTLRRGSHADLTLFDPARKWTYYVVDSPSKSRNTPYDGWEFKGRPVATIIAGGVVFKA